MKVALVYDQVNKFGGAERLLLALQKIYPQAPLYTLVHNPKSASWASKFRVIPSPINFFEFLRTRHQWLSPLASMMFETFDFSAFNLVISITSSNAKAVITKPETFHLCYCLTPTRFYWGRNAGQYNRDLKMKILPKPIKKYFKSVDLLISKRPDQYIAISKEVKTRIDKYYKRKSTVIYPPIENKFFSNKTFTPQVSRSYYLMAGRQEPYKRSDLVINAFHHLQGRTLKVVGTGSQIKKLKKMASKNVEFLSRVSDRELIDLYSHAKAVIFPQVEDFGLVPLEAQGLGTPVIAFNQGGAKETIVDKRTGIFFSSQTCQSLLGAIEKLESGHHRISPLKCHRNALRFSQDRFIIKFRDKVNKLWKEHRKNFM